MNPSSPPNSSPNLVPLAEFDHPPGGAHEGPTDSQLLVRASGRRGTAWRVLIPPSG
jgi:hypothetical protein